LALVMAGCALVAVAPAMAQTSPTTTAAPAPEKKICRAQEVTGSIMPGRKTCHTKAEWASIDGVNEAHAAQIKDNRGTVQN
jgi:predicted secreted protein